MSLFDDIGKQISSSVDKVTERVANTDVFGQIERQGRATVERGVDYVKRTYDEYEAKVSGALSRIEGAAVPGSPAKNGQEAAPDKLQFPSDLGSESLAHMVIFEISIPDVGRTYENLKTSGKVSQDGGPRIQSARNSVFRTSPENLKRVLDTAAVRVVAATGVEVNNAVSEEKKNVDDVISSISPAKYKKLQQIIALPFPEGMVSDYSVMWGRREGGMAAGALAIADKLGAGEGTGENIAKSVAMGALGGIAGFLQSMGLEGLNTVYEATMKRSNNPRSEFLFDGVNNRSFNMAFKLTPRNPEDAKAMVNILETFRNYMYPEIDRNHLAGAFYIYPGIFDITFYDGAQENTWVYRTSSCALTNMTVNYNGAGQWVGVEGSDERQGAAPASIELNLQFAEMQFLERADFESGSVR